MLLPGGLREHCKQIIYTQPGFVTVTLQQNMSDAEQLAAYALPPGGTELCSKMAYDVVIEFGLHLEQQAAVLLALHFDAFMRCLEI